MSCAGANPSVNNARSDKLDVWAESWQQRRRCLIPIQTFYEWTGPTCKKQTFAFESENSDSRLWAAGIWEPGDDEPAYSVLTTSASEAVSPIHDRMPALLKPENFDEFLAAENPLSNSESHQGPIPQDLLPGFGGI